MYKIWKIKLMTTITSAIFLLAASSSTAFADEIMLFVGDGCPHCANVEKYLEKNNIYSKLPITIYEVWHNDENARLYTQKAEELDYTNGYVPLLIDGEKYVDGDKPIIKYIDELLAAQSGTIANQPTDTIQPTDQPPSEPEELSQSVLSPDDQNTLKNMLAENPQTNTTKSISFPLIIGAVIILVVGLIIAKIAGRGR
ncbi:MAG: hypothetical protein WC269_02390 [Candidatus Gracilibacteria bacterium]|jgi:glutaredoxin